MEAAINFVSPAQLAYLASRLNFAGCTARLNCYYTNTGNNNSANIIAKANEEPIWSTELKLQ